MRFVSYRDDFSIFSLFYHHLSHQSDVRSARQCEITILWSTYFFCCPLCIYLIPEDWSCDAYGNAQTWWAESREVIYGIAKFTIIYYGSRYRILFISSWFNLKHLISELKFFFAFKSSNLNRWVEWMSCWFLILQPSKTVCFAVQRKHTWCLYMLN